MYQSFLGFSDKPVRSVPVRGPRRLTPSAKRGSRPSGTVRPPYCPCWTPAGTPESLALRAWAPAGQYSPPTSGPHCPLPLRPQCREPRSNHAFPVKPHKTKPSCQHACDVQGPYPLSRPASASPAHFPQPHHAHLSTSLSRASSAPGPLLAPTPQPSAKPSLPPSSPLSPSPPCPGGAHPGGDLAEGRLALA